MLLVAKAFFMCFGVDLSSTPESRFDAGLSKLNSGWTPFSFITLVFDCNLRLLSRCNCRHGFLTPINGQADHDKQRQSASTDLRFRLSLCCWIGTPRFGTCAPLLCWSRWTCHSVSTSQTWGAHSITLHSQFLISMITEFCDWCRQGDLGL